MDALMHAVGLASLAAYFIAALAYLAGLYGYKRCRAREAFVVGFVLHTLALGAILVGGTIFLENGADYLFLVSWFLAVTCIWFRSKLDYPIVGALAAPLVMVTMASSSYLLHAGSQSFVQSDRQMEVAIVSLHALPAILATVSLALGLVVSIVFLVTERKLRRRGNILAINGPSLETLDKLNGTFVKGGFLGITLVVVSGSLWAVSQQRPWIPADSTVLLGILIWFFLAFILHARSSLTWSARRISVLTLLACGLYLGAVIALIFATGHVTHVTYG